MRPGSLKLTAQNEQYLYNTVDRIEKETSSGGGSSSGGSTTHTSSSGTTHGGLFRKVLEVPHMTDVKKVIALNRLRAQMLDEEVSPAQKQYYLELAQWLENQNIQTAEEATESIKNTPYYDGAALAKELDGIHLRIRAARELGYEDVEKIHLQRREKLLSKGLQAYAFSQEWIDDYNRAQEASVRYMERKEVFGRIFRAYIRICGSPQREHRLEAVKDMKAALSELEQMGVSFEELAQQKAYRQLTMTTEEGMARFVAFVEEFKKTGTAAGAVDLNHLKKERRVGAGPRSMLHS